jgi:peptidoglycan/xylan/chitin deacetylase (PgdA/CDA1 family)
MWRRALKVGSAAALAATGIGRVLGRLGGGVRPPLILGYHRVVPEYRPDPSAVLSPMLIDVAMLEAQLDWVGRRYRFVSLDELWTLPTSSLSRVAAVTVDDGYRDAYEVAFPLFRRKGIPAAFFVVTDLVGASEVPLFDRLYFQLAQRFAREGRFPCSEMLRGASSPYDALQILLIALDHAALLDLAASLERELPMPVALAAQLRSLDWEMARRMDAEGMTIGSHTCRHVFLSCESAETVADELTRSKREIEARVGKPVRHFAYPAGEFNAQAARAVAAAGYDHAYTICTHVEPEQPLVTVPRRVLWQGSCASGGGRFSPALMSAQISGALDFIHPPCLLDHRREQGLRRAPQPVVASA